MSSADRDLARVATRAAHVDLARRVDGRSPSPTPLWYDPELEVLVQWFPLDLRLPALADVPDLDRAEVLGYAPGRRAVLRPDHLDRAASAVEVVAAVAPSLRARARAVLAALEDALPDNPRGVLAHGAFHAGELLREDDRLAVVDFDDVCRAPAALDLATFAGA